MHHNGFNAPRDPILEPIESIKLMDAILDLSDPDHPKEPKWPKADFIVGNPPFLGDKLMRGGLGHDYVEALRACFEDRIPGQSDLCCYWFEKARQALVDGVSSRVGLLATQGIRGGANRRVLDRIKADGDIFWAVSDRKWLLDGAMVHVSMVGFDNGTDMSRMLDGDQVATINSNLTRTADVTRAMPIQQNAGRSFIGAAIHGPFDLTLETAIGFLASPNVHGRPNSDIIRPWANGLTITKRESDLWIIDVPPGVDLESASLYEKPFEYLQDTVLPVREKNRRQMRRINWWILGDPQKAMRAALQDLPRFLITPRVSKFRLFI